jgi:CheY-like chemotaxis protein
MLEEHEILNASILIVDDQEANVEVLEQLLLGAGYTQISTTTTPTAVCGLHAGHAYDLILLDLQMPFMDGFAVMDALKLQLGTHNLPVLVLTAQPNHKLRALQSGARDFISKPFDLMEVKTRIHNMLETRLLYRQLAQHNCTLEATVAKRTAELRASEERYRRLTELACDWHWEQDADGNLIQVSGPVEEMLSPLLANINEPILPHAQHADLDQDGWNRTQRQQLQHYLVNRQPFIDLAMNRLTSSGNVEHFRICGEPIFDESGRFIGYRGTGVECAGPKQ